MKILNKINRQFIILSVSALSVLILPLYFLILSLQENEVTESLRTTETWVYHSIPENGQIPRVYPLFEVSPCESQRNPVFRDTLILDPVENDLERFTELTTVRNINGKFFQITVRTYSPEKSNLAVLLFLIFLAVLVILNTTLILINRHVSRTVWHQFSDILATIREFSLQRLEPVRPVNTGITEFRELNSEIVKLTNRILHDFNSVRQFSENAAHELQTPLMIIRNRVDALLSAPGMTPDQMKKAAAIEEAIDRLSRLNKQLLMLAKIENRQFSRPEKIAFSAFLESKISDFQEFADLRSIHLILETRQDIIREMDRELADILFNNLINNALKYTPKQGQIQVLLEAPRITVSNSGSSALSDPDRIFERFYRENSDSQSTGLGLALVRAVAEAAGIRIDYRFEGGMHHFILDF